MSSQSFTDGVTLTQASWFNDVDTSAYSGLTSVSGTNTIAATGPASMTAYATGQNFRFIPAVTNTGATTINITCNSVALGAKSIFRNGVALTGGELRATIPVLVAYDGTQFHVIGNGFNPPIAHGCCYLSKSAANLLLSPKQGSTIIINSIPQVIPDAGVTLAIGAAAANTTYFIYAFMSAGTMTLEFSATGHSAQAGTGVEIKTGDATRTLVGMARANASPAWEDDSALIGVLSYFNRRNKGITVLQGSTGTSSGSVVELGGRNNFLIWGDESYHCVGHGTVNNSSGGTVTTMYLAADSTSGTDESTFWNNGAVTGIGGVHAPWAIGYYKSGLSEGFHFVTINANVSAGGSTMTVTTLSGMTRG